MILNDKQIGMFVSKVLHLGPGKRKAYIDQVNNLISEMTRKISNDSSFKVKGFKKTGSLMKGTVLKPKGDYGVDADVAAFLDLSEAEKDDIDELHNIILELLMAVYPMKVEEDFKVQPRTLGIHFRVSGLDVDLVPVIPIPTEPGYGWQPSSQQGEPVKTSIQGQLDFIKARKDADSRFRTLVRLLKRWRNEHELDRFRSFTIELILSHLYDRDGTSKSLESGLKRFFFYIAQDQLKTPITFPENGVVSAFPKDPVVILDPVNVGNNVAGRLSDGERQEIVRAATAAWEKLETASWKDEKGATLDLWKEIMGRSFTVDED